jgi:hypothetical protein
MYALRRSPIGHSRSIADPAERRPEFSSIEPRWPQQVHSTVDPQIVGR